MKTPALLLLVVLASTGCLVAVQEGDGGTGGGAGGGTGGGTGGGIGSCGCQHDSDCSAGTICEVDPRLTCPSGGSGGACVIGCRVDTQCRAGETCVPTQCIDSACVPGTCEKCVDQDEDGYTAGCDPLSVCPGKKSCDCDDKNAKRSPGVTEICDNGIDDNCDGRVDRADPKCLACSQGQAACVNHFACGFEGKMCSDGCCEYCPAFPPDACPVDQSFFPTGIDPANGCATPPECASTPSCPKIYAPVCAQNYATYENECLMKARNQSLLHTGPCLPGEGLACNLGSDGDACGRFTHMYCRDTCPICGAGPPQARCTQEDACVFDVDCNGQSNGARCDGGTPKAQCVSHSCQFSCQ